RSLTGRTSVRKISCARPPAEVAATVQSVMRCFPSKKAAKISTAAAAGQVHGFTFGPRKRRRLLRIAPPRPGVVEIPGLGTSGPGADFFALQLESCRLVEICRDHHAVAAEALGLVHRAVRARHECIQ